MARYDHSVRVGSIAFTDHSACIVEGEVPTVRIQRSTLPNMKLSTDDRVTVIPTIHPENTAKRRSSPSRPVSALVESGYLSEWNVRSILDFGYGYGMDITYLRGLGFDVGGYDPHPAFGFSTAPHDLCDLVILSFVLSVYRRLLPRDLPRSSAPHATSSKARGCSRLPVQRLRLSGKPDQETGNPTPMVI